MKFYCSNLRLLLHQNIGSVFSNFDSLFAGTNSLSKMSDAIVLKDVWISYEEGNFYNIAGYKMYTKYNISYSAGRVIAYIGHKYHCLIFSVDTVSCDDLLLDSVNKLF